MFGQCDYFETARANEAVFRNILRNLAKGNRAYVPRNLETELPLEELFDKYSRGNRYGIFTITDFRISSTGVAVISYEDIATLSGGGATLSYKISGEQVTYAGVECVVMS